MKKVFQKSIACLTALTMACAISPLFMTAVNAEGNGTTVDLGTFTDPTAASLNSVLDYGVFALNYTADVDMEANIAAETASAKANTGVSTNTEWAVAGSSSIDCIENFAAGTTWASLHPSSASTVMILPDDVTVNTTYNNGNGITVTDSTGHTVFQYNSLSELGASAVYQISDTTYVIDFDQAFAGMESYASAESAKTNAGVTVEETADTVNITCEEGDDVVNLTTAQLQKKINVTGNNTTEYSLVINVTDASGNIALNNPITIDGTRDSYSSESSHVLINFGSAYTGTVTLGESTMGSILAPNASVKVTSTHNGSVYAVTVENVSGEIHQSRFTTTGSTPETPKEDTTTPADTTPTEDTTTPTDTTPTEDTTSPVTPTEETTTPVTPTEETTTPAATTTEVTTPVTSDSTTTEETTTEEVVTPVTTDTTETEETTAEETETTARPSTPDTGAGEEIPMAFGFLAASLAVIGGILIYKKKYAE
jgi:hypothetical protein